jgi:uncharacterized membrane protein YhaH (DUF805 family)
MRNYSWSTKGRISRGKFWLQCFAAAIPWGVAFVVCKRNVETNGPFLAILASVLVQVTCLQHVIIQGIKRMHDVNRDSWALFIPIYGLVATLTPGTSGPNRFGNSPE